MEFTELQSFTKLGLEGAGCLLLCVIAYKIYKMKIHSRSGCCGDKFIIETMNKGNSSRNLEFTNMNKETKKENTDNEII